MSSLISFILLSTQQGYKIEFEADEENDTFATKLTLSKTYNNVLFKDEFKMTNILMEQQGELAVSIVLKQVLDRINHAMKYYDYPKEN